LVVEMVVEQKASGALCDPKAFDFWLVNAYYNPAKSSLTFFVTVTRVALCVDHKVGSDDAAATRGMLQWTVRREDGGDHEPRRADQAEGAGDAGRG
jgi:hypothetical protein